MQNRPKWALIVLKRGQKGDGFGPFPACEARFDSYALQSESPVRSIGIDMIRKMGFLPVSMALFGIIQGLVGVANAIHWVGHRSKGPHVCSILEQMQTLDPNEAESLRVFAPRRQMN